MDEDFRVFVVDAAHFRVQVYRKTFKELSPGQIDPVIPSRTPRSIRGCAPLKGLGIWSNLLGDYGVASSLSPHPGPLPALALTILTVSRAVTPMPQPQPPANEPRSIHQTLP